MTKTIDFIEKKNQKDLQRGEEALASSAPTPDQQNTRYVHSEADYRQFHESVHGAGTFILNPAFTEEDAEDLYLGDSPEYFGYQNFEYKLDPEKVSFEEWKEYITHIDASELVKLDGFDTSNYEYDLSITAVDNAPYKGPDSLPTLQAIQKLLSESL